MDELNEIENGMQNLDIEQKFLATMRELPLNRKINNFNVIPNIVLQESLIEELEQKIKSFEGEAEYSKKNEEFLKFYNGVLKKSFEDILKERAHLVNTEFPEGCFKNNVEACDINARKLKIKTDLPVFKYHDEILKTLDENRFVLIKGETGSGKTTQVPQFILDHNIKKGKFCQIICTQPRRISAISIAERVAYERGEELGASVGYQIRLETVPPRPADSILYCTTGILLRMLASDPILANVSHIIIDEIHERNIESDLLIGLIQLIVTYNKQIKVLLMSATFGFEEFSKNFSNCKIINIEGTLHPVMSYYLEDVLENLKFFDFPNAELYLQQKHSNYYKTPQGREEKLKLDKFKIMVQEYTRTILDQYSYRVIDALKNPFSENINLSLIEQLINYIDQKMPKGAILVFLPGYEVIFNLYDLLVTSVESRGKNYIVYPVHSLMPTGDQKGIFDPPPNKFRKIILATNIAETSITIDDIVYVIDSGKAKVKYYDIKNKIETLEEYWIPKASAIQRLGRAGRCGPGICFHLYTRAREQTFEEYYVPEIQRTRMEQVIITLKFLKIHDVKSFLLKLISCPDERSVQNGIDFLQKINALDKDQVITPLGLHIAQLPLDHQIGKMLLIAAIFGCIDPITTVAATLSLKEPFRRAFRKQNEVDDIKREFDHDSHSDHITYANVIKEYRQALGLNYIDNFCSRNFINTDSVQEIEKMKIQLCELLASTGFIKSSSPRFDESNISSNDIEVLRAVIAGGLYPNVAILRSASFRYMKKFGKQLPNHIIQTPDDGIDVRFHCTSVNRKQVDFNSKFFSYFNKHKSQQFVFLRESTMISPISIIIFSNKLDITSDQHGTVFIVVGDNTFRFPTNEQTAHILCKLRECFQQIVTHLSMHPTAISNLSRYHINVIEALKILFKKDTYIN